MAKAAKKTEVTTELCDDKDFSQIEAGIRYVFERPSTAAKALIEFLGKLRTTTTGGGAVADPEVGAKITALEAKITALEADVAALKATPAPESTPKATTEVSAKA